MIKKNQHYAKTVAEILLLCSQQGVLLWGHDESIKLLKKGNFKEFLSLVANDDMVVAEKLQQRPGKALYTSQKILNDIIHIMVGQQICICAHHTGYYSILADETKNMSKQEQISTLLHWSWWSNFFSCGVILHFFVASNLTAEQWSMYILNTLSIPFQPKCQLELPRYELLHVTCHHSLCHDMT